MRNITTEVKGDKLIVTMDITKKALTDAPMSSSGKTKLVATTGGALPIQMPNGNSGALSFACNLMLKP